VPENQEEDCYRSVSPVTPGKDDAHKRFLNLRKFFLRDQTVFLVGVSKHGIADARQGKACAVANLNPGATNSLTKKTNRKSVKIKEMNLANVEAASNTSMRNRVDLGRVARVCAVNQINVDAL
jgi:hypothetical protein